MIVGCRVGQPLWATALALIVGNHHRRLSGISWQFPCHSRPMPAPSVAITRSMSPMRRVPLPSDPPTGHPYPVEWGYPQRP